MSKIKIILLVPFIVFISQSGFAQLSEQELLAAIKFDDISKIQSYFENKDNNPNMLIGEQKVPLIHYVSSIDKYKTIEILINTGANLNALYDNDSPIMTAIYYNNLKIVELLLKNGVNVNFKSTNGKTAAISAVIYNKPKALELLKKYNANFTIKDQSNKSAIDYAWELQHIECYMFLSNEIPNKYKNMPVPSYSDGPYATWEGKSKLKVSYLSSDSVTKNINKLDSIIIIKKNEPIIKNENFPFEISIRKIKKNQSSPFEFQNVKKIMAIGDLHGEFDTFKDFLINNKIIDINYNWTFGDGHLVLIGDIFDRGSKVNECFWLLYKLEVEAQQHDGEVHFIIGNHEVMEMSGDKRYLSKKYLFLFNKLKLNYTDAYDKNSELGRWLRTKNAIIKINDILFVHGGLSNELVDRKLKINTINEVVKNIINRKDMEPKTDIERFILGSDGPLWYRGYIKLGSNYYKSTGSSYDITQEKVDRIIDYFSVKAIVFANTHVNEICPMFNNKLYGIDIPFAEKNVELQGLYIENGNFYKAFMNGTKKIIK